MMPSGILTVCYRQILYKWLICFVAMEQITGVTLVVTRFALAGHGRATPIWIEAAAILELSRRTS